MNKLLAELNNLIIKYKFRPSRSSGQNFIISHEIIEKVLKHADLKETDVVLEIGPGTGFLTKELLKKSRVKAIEVDEKLVNLLEKEINDGKFELIKGDFTKILGRQKIAFNKVVSFPPYNESKKLIELLCLLKPEKAVLVMQKEFADKLDAFPGMTEYTAITVLAQFFFNVRISEIVPKESFHPIPQSESKIIVLEKKQEAVKISDEKKFMEFVSELFRIKNKDIKSALREINKKMPFDLKRLDELDEHSKVMLLNIEKIAEIFNFCFEENN